MTCPLSHSDYMAEARSEASSLAPKLLFFHSGQVDNTSTWLTAFPGPTLL